jgi:hypothetical protein
MSDQGRVAIVTAGARAVAGPDALTSVFQRSLLACSTFLLAAVLIALRATNTRGETVDPRVTSLPDVQPFQPEPEGGK